MGAFVAKEQKYVDLTLDPGFKAVFLDQENKHLLQDLINRFLPKGRQIAEIDEYIDREIEGYTPVNKGVRVDIVCRDEQGRSFIVEMQNYQFDRFFMRCVHYSAMVLNAAVKKGKFDYAQVQPVYLIALVNVPLKEPELTQEPHDLVSWYTFTDVKYKNLAPDAINIIFVRLNELRKELAECATEEERYCYYLKNMATMEEIPEEEEQDMIRSLFEASHIASFSPEKKLQYDLDMRSIWDQKAIEHQIRLDGFEEGMAKGEAQGKAALIKAMLANGMSIEALANVTGMSAEIIMGLAGKGA